MSRFDGEAMDEAAEGAALQARVHPLHLRQRLGIESEHEVEVFGWGRRFFHLENWYSVHGFIRNALRLSGLYRRGRRNAADIRVRHNDIELAGLPASFHDYRVLHLSDLHLDMDPSTTHALIERVRELDYELCVMTGDYRAKTFGDHREVVRLMARVRAHLRDPIYGVLGNHDTIRMVPGFEALGVRMLLNESVPIEVGGECIYLVGIDDAHYFGVDDIVRAAHDIPHDAVSLFLSHTPEVYRHAAHAGFDVMLCGHTHGGQICLPGGVALTWDANCPRRLAAGSWRHRDLQGYTSVGAGTSIVPARLNCPAEITVHRLRRADAQ